jgi:hypothetical protein
MGRARRDIQAIDMTGFDSALGARRGTVPASTKHITSQQLIADMFAREGFHDAAIREIALRIEQDIFKKEDYLALSRGMQEPKGAALVRLSASGYYNWKPVGDALMQAAQHDNSHAVQTLADIWHHHHGRGPYKEQTDPVFFALKNIVDDPVQYRAAGTALDSFIRSAVDDREAHYARITNTILEYYASGETTARHHAHILLRESESKMRIPTPYLKAISLWAAEDKPFADTHSLDLAFALLDDGTPYGRGEDELHTLAQRLSEYVQQQENETLNLRGWRLLQETVSNKLLLDVGKPLFEVLKSQLQRATDNELQAAARMLALARGHRKSLYIKDLSDSINSALTVDETVSSRRRILVHDQLKLRDKPHTQSYQEARAFLMSTMGDSVADGSIQAIQPLAEVLNIDIDFVHYRQEVKSIYSRSLQGFSSDSAEHSVTRLTVNTLTQAILQDQDKLFSKLDMENSFEPDELRVLVARAITPTTQVSVESLSPTLEAIKTILQKSRLGS